MAIFSWYDCKLKNVNPAVPTKMVLMSIKVVFFVLGFFLPLQHWSYYLYTTLIFISTFSNAEIFWQYLKCCGLFFLLHGKKKMALRYNTTLSHRVWKHHFGSAPALVLIIQGRLPMRLHLQPLPGIVLFIAPITRTILELSNAKIL